MKDQISNSTEFWDHSKQHSSKTRLRRHSIVLVFWDHSKQHSSKTGARLD